MTIIEAPVTTRLEQARDGMPDSDYAQLLRRSVDAYNTAWQDERSHDWSYLNNPTELVSRRDSLGALRVA